MKVLLCYPPVSPDYDKIRDAGVAPHLSLVCLGSHLMAEFDDVDVEIVDGHHYTMEEIKNTISSYEPDMFGMSVDFTNYQSAIILAEHAKNVGDVLTWCGSNHATNMYKQTLLNRPQIDYISLNDGERSVEMLVRFKKGEADITSVPNLAYRVDGEIKLTNLEVFDLAKMHDVNYEMITLDDYFMLQNKIFGDSYRMMQFTTQRGCANKPLCVFCGRFDHGMRFRDPVLCAKEIARYTEKYNLTEVWDRSDSFIQNRNWLKSFAEALNKETNRFRDGITTFKTYSRADQLLNQETLDILKSLNFRMVFIGYEAGDDRILKNIGKHANIDTYYRATKMVLDNGIGIDASFIVGLPGENKESMANHIAFVQNLSDIGLNKIRVNRLLVLPGTPLYRAFLKAFPEYEMCDIVPMEKLQSSLFETELYDLSEFDGSVAAYIDALNDTARKMADIIKNRGGGTEGYGHGKGRNILEGSEIRL